MILMLLLIRFVIDPFRGELELDERQNQDDNKENPGEGGSVPHLEVLKRIFEEVHHWHQQTIDRTNGFAWIAATQHIDAVKLLEGADRPDDEVEENVWREHGKRHVLEFLPPVRPVDISRFIEMNRNAL